MQQRKQSPVEYFSAGQVLDSPVHGLSQYLLAFPCKEHRQSQKRAKGLGQRESVALVELDGVVSCRLVLELSMLNAHRVPSSAYLTLPPFLAQLLD